MNPHGSVILVGLGRPLKRCGRSMVRWVMAAGLCHISNVAESRPLDVFTGIRKHVLEIEESGH